MLVVSFLLVLYSICFVFCLKDKDDGKFEPKYKKKGKSSSAKRHLRKKGHTEEEKRVRIILIVFSLSYHLWCYSSLMVCGFLSVTVTSEKTEGRGKKEAERREDRIHQEHHLSFRQIRQDIQWLNHYLFYSFIQLDSPSFPYYCHIYCS